jgi:Protein of unknown function (DUF4238)
MPEQKSPHRHHYIPQMVLRNFVNAGGGLYFWRREFAVGAVRSTATQNLFLEDNLYTIVGDDGEHNATLEQGFARMESTGAHLIGQLLTTIRSGAVPRLNEEAWEFFHHFHYHSGKRSAAWHRRFVSRDEVMAVANDLAKEPHWTDADRAWLNDQPDLDRVMNNARIAAQATPPPEELLAAMRQRGMAVYTAPPRCSYVLGDHPTAMARIGGADSGKMGRLLSFMPVAHDVAVGFYAKPRTVRVEQMTRQQIRLMNEAMTRQSMMIAGRSHALVRSLSRVGYATPDYFATGEYLVDGSA